MAIIDTLQVVIEMASDRATASLRAFDKQLSFAHASFKKFAADISVQSQISSAAFLKGFTGITDWLTGVSPTFQAYMDAIGFEFTAFGETIANDVQPEMDILLASLDRMVTMYEGLPEPIRQATSLLITLGLILGVVSAAITLLAPLVSSLTMVFAPIASLLAYENALAGIETVSYGVGLASSALAVAVAIALALIVGAAIGFADAWNKNLGWALLVAEWFSTGVSGIFQGIYTFVKGIWDALSSLLRGDTQGTLDGLREMFDGFVMFIQGIFLTAVATIAGFFLGLGTTLKNVLTVVWDIGTQIGAAIVNAIGSGISGAIGGVSGFAGSLLSSVKGILGLAEGGIVTGPTLAVVGERGPEAVVPLNQAGGMGLGSTTIGPIYITGSMNTDQDLQDLARRLVQYMHQESSAYNLAFGTKR